MKRLFFIVCVLIIAITSNAQQIELQGVVKVNNSETNTGNPQFVEDLQIRYTSNSVIFYDITGTDGKFLINISNVKEIEIQNIEVTFNEKYKDYYVVNKSIIRKDFVEILVFSKKENERLKQQAKTKLLQPYKEELAKMIERDKKSGQIISILRDSIVIQDKIIKEKEIEIDYVLEHWLSIDLDKSSDNYKQAFDLIIKGELEKALGYIPRNEEKIQGIIEVNNKMIEDAKLRIAIYKVLNNTENVIIEYHFLIDNSKSIEEERLYRQELVDYLKSINASNNANEENRKRFERNKNINIAGKIDDINAFNSQAEIDKQNKIQNIHKNYIKAIKTYKNLKKEFENIPANADKEVALSYTRLANYYDNKKKHQKAENNYKKAEKIYISLIENNNPDNINHLHFLLDFATYYTQFRKNDLVKQCGERVNVLLKTTALTEEDKVKISIKQGDLALVSNDTVKGFARNLVDGVYYKDTPYTPDSYWKYKYGYDYMSSPYNYYLNKYKENPYLKDDLIKISLKVIYAASWDYYEALSMCDSVIKIIGTDTNTYKKEIALTEILRGRVLKFQSMDVFQTTKNTIKNSKKEFKNQKLRRTIKQIKKEHKDDTIYFNQIDSIKLEIAKNKELKGKHNELKKMIVRIQKDNKTFDENIYVYYSEIDSAKLAKMLSDASLSFYLKEQSKCVLKEAKDLAKATKDKDLIRFANSVQNYESNRFFDSWGNVTLSVGSWGALYFLVLFGL